MMRWPVRSRRWNWALAILGAVYAVSATVLLVWLTVDVWQAEGLADRALQIALLGSAIVGIWLCMSAARHLGADDRTRLHGAQLKRTTAL